MTGTGTASKRESSGLASSPGRAPHATVAASAPMPAASTPYAPRALEKAAPGAGPTLPQILICLAAVWCAAICLRVPPAAATTGLAAMLGLLFLLLLPFHRWACFLVLVAACAFEDVLRSWTPVRYNTVHYATLVLLPVAFLLVRPRARLPIPLIFWAGMCLWFAISVFWSRDPKEWLNWLTEYCGVAGLALLTRQLATSPRRRRELGLVFAFTSMAVITAMLVVFGVGSGERFGTAGALNANGVGRLAAMGMLMLAISSAESSRRSMLSPLNVGLYLALGVGLLLTQSRGSMLAALGAALTIALAQPRVHHRLIGVTACLFLGAGLVFTAMQLDPQSMERRWRSTFESRDLASATAGRSEIARTAHLILKDHWVAGVGAGQFAYAYQEYSVLARSRYHNSGGASAHSGYLRIPTEGGVVAALLLLGFYAALWRGASRLPPGQRRAVARAILVYMLIGLLSSEGIEKENWLAIGLLLVWFWENRGFRSDPIHERHEGTRRGASTKRGEHE